MGHRLFEIAGRSDLNLVSGVSAKVIINLTLDEVWDTPIMDGGQKAPQFNSAIWCLTKRNLALTEYR